MPVLKQSAGMVWPIFRFRIVIFLSVCGEQPNEKQNINNEASMKATTTCLSQAGKVD